MNVVRQFDVFEKTSEYIFEEIEIQDFDLKTVKGLLDNPKSDPLLYDGYKVEGEIKLYFERLGFVFLTEKYDYFLCCYQDNIKQKSK